MKMTDQDKKMSYEDSTAPDWQAHSETLDTILKYAKFVKQMLCQNRYNPVPESGLSRGLTLVLDAHNDLITAASIPDYFQVLLHSKLSCDMKKNHFAHFRALKQ